MSAPTPPYIVQSLAGHDKGRLFYVLRAEDDFAGLVDGKLRRLSNPKRKRRKHLAFMAEGASPVAEKIRLGVSVTDRQVYKSLNAYRADVKTAKGGN